MTVTVDFDINPRRVRHDDRAHRIQFYDKSYDTAGTTAITSWSWEFGDGATSSLQSPLHFYLSAGDYSVTLAVNGTTTLSTSNAVIVSDTTIAAPSKTGNWGRISIIIINTSSWTDGTIVNIRPNSTIASPYGHLFYQNLEVQDTMNRAGDCKFTIWQDGSAGTAEKSLIATGNMIVIVNQSDVIWQGVISRVVQNKLQSSTSTSISLSWDIECESAISMMRNQSLNSASITTYSGNPALHVLNMVLEPSASTDFDWRGTTSGITEKTKARALIPSQEGLSVDFEAKNTDMLSNFQRLAALTDFDWRTRCNYISYNYTGYTGSGSTGLFSITNTAPFNAADDFNTANYPMKCWISVVQDTVTLGGTLYSNTSGVICAGYISGGVGSTGINVSWIGLSMGAYVPSSGKIVVIRQPILEASMNLQTSDPLTDPSDASYIPIFQVNSNLFDFDDKTDYKSLGTKITTQAVDPVTDKHVTSSVIANQQFHDYESGNTLSLEHWNNSAYIKHKTEGYVAGFDTAYSGIVAFLEGWGWALQSGDTFSIYDPNAGGWVWSNKNLAAGVTETYADGQSISWLNDNRPITEIAWTGAVSTNFPAGCYFILHRWYIGNNNLISSPHTYVGDEHVDLTNGGTDTKYGLYKTFDQADRGLDSTIMYPHMPGTLIFDESLDDLSPYKLYGKIIKTYTVSTAAMKAELDVFNSHLIYSGGLLHKHATAWCSVYDYWSYGQPTAWVTRAGTSQYLTQVFPRPGDKIRIRRYSGDLVGETWQIVGWKYIANEGRVFLELGDFDKDVYQIMDKLTSAYRMGIK